MAKSPTGEVWGLLHGKLHKFTGVRIGAYMLTFPDGQRWSKDGYYGTELEAAIGTIKKARWSLNYHRNQVAGYESIVADCERVLGDAAVENDDD